MISRLVIRPTADREVEEHATFIARDNESAALRFTEAVQSAFERLLEFPSIGAIRSFRNKQLEGLRAWPIPGFKNYLIFYRIESDWIEIIRVLHGARDLEAALLER